MRNIFSYYINVILISFFLSSCDSVNSTYAIKSFIKHTGLKKGYTIIKKKVEYHQIFILANIDLIDKEAILLKHKLVNKDSLANLYLIGKVDFHLFKFNDDYKYFMIYGYDYYGYVVIGISPSKNELIYCENGPDHALNPDDLAE